MPRTWQYSRWRRLALQGAMCLLLGLGVGAAAWVGQKRRPPAAELGPTTQYGMLRYALPAGWTVDTKALPFELSADETHAYGRLLRVMVDRRRGRQSDADRLLMIGSMGPRAGVPVTFLGRQGILIERSFRTQPAPGAGRPSTGEEEEGDELESGNPFGAIKQGLFAAVVLEDGVGVIVSLEGMAAGGPTNRAMLKQVLATMQRVPATQLTTQPATNAASQPATRGASQKSSP